MKRVWQMIIGAVLFGAGLLVSAWLLKGNAAGDWVDALLYIGLAAFLLSQAYFLMQDSQKKS